MPSFPCLRGEALQRAGVETGIQSFPKYRFPASSAGQALLSQEWQIEEELQMKKARVFYLAFL
jgi:hypothetical protein